MGSLWDLGIEGLDQVATELLESTYPGGGYSGDMMDRWWELWHSAAVSGRMLDAMQVRPNMEPWVHDCMAMDRFHSSSPYDIRH